MKETTDCIAVSLEDNPMEVLKGCSGLMACLDESFADNIYNYQAIQLLADVMTDAVTRLDEKSKEMEK